MQDVYCIGHGFMDAADEIQLAVAVHTYVKDGEMLDGRKIANVITSGPEKGYKITSNVEQWKANPPNKKMREHYLCSDLASYKDVNTTEKWHKKTNRREINAGVFFDLPGGDFLFFTKNSQAVRLSKIVESVKTAIGSNFQIHWTACRSVIRGDNDTSKLLQINGGDLVNAQSLT